MELINIFNKYNLYMKKEFLKDIKSIIKEEKSFILIFKSGEVKKFDIPYNNYTGEDIALRRLRHYILKINKTCLLSESKTEYFKKRCQL